MSDGESLTAWESKAHKVIGELCYAEWDKANRYVKGKGRPKKTRPYTVPDIAADLMKMLAMKDRSEAEREIKALLLHHNHIVHLDNIKEKK